MQYQSPTTRLLTRCCHWVFSGCSYPTGFSGFTGSLTRHHSPWLYIKSTESKHVSVFTSLPPRMLHLATIGHHTSLQRLTDHNACSRFLTAANAVFPSLVYSQPGFGCQPDQPQTPFSYGCTSFRGYNQTRNSLHIVVQYHRCYL